MVEEEAEELIEQGKIQKLTRIVRTSMPLDE
jgi:hypothetical protein